MDYCKSPHAADFILDTEVLETLDYAEKNKRNRSLIESLLEKAGS